MIHSRILKADEADGHNPPDTPGEPCRSIGSCTPIEMYSSYIGPAPKMNDGYGGPRVYVRTAGGQISSLPIKSLTTNQPHSCTDHIDLWKHMIEIHVLKTREAPDPATLGKYRESAKSRNERKDRMQAWHDSQVGA